MISARACRAFARAAAAAPFAAPVRADQASGDVCMGTLFTEATDGQVGCTANDIRIARATNVSVPSCIVGTRFDFTATFELRLSGGGSKQTRFDNGLYFDINGDPEGDGARGGICTVAVASDGEPGFLNLDGDTCGDINTGKTRSSRRSRSTTSSAPTHRRRRARQPAELRELASAGFESALRRGRGRLPRLTVEVQLWRHFQHRHLHRAAGRIGQQVATQACVMFQITVNNPTVTNSLTLIALNDAPYGNVADAANPNLCSTDCDLDPAPVIGPGQSFTCEFAARVADSSSNQTDTVTATMTSDGDTITRTASDTILVDLNP